MIPTPQIQPPAVAEAKHLLKQGRAKEAETLLRIITSSRPSPESQKLLGELLLHTSRPKPAIVHLESALAHMPGNDNLRLTLSIACQRAGEYAKALENLACAWSLAPGNPAVRNALEQTAQHIRPLGDDRALADCLAQLLMDDSLQPQAYARPAAQLLALTLPDLMELPVKPLAVEQFAVRAAQLPLFRALLIRTINLDARLEQALTRLRKTLLLRYIEDLPDSYTLELICILGCQSALNEYVFALTAEECTSLAKIKRLITQHAFAVRHITYPTTCLLALYAMYQPLDALDVLHELSPGQISLPHPTWNVLMRLALQDRLQERQIAAGLPSLGDISDPVSLAVQAQYEHNPYPRWHALPILPKQPIALKLKTRFPGFSPPAFLGQDHRVLVAGCGTGLHPLALASSRPSAQVTAIDISRRSLAYASMMANRLGIQNVCFLQADILYLDRLHIQFEWIEAGGVLHHMRDTLLGLKVLARRLVPGGLLRLALYSRRAREPLARVRELLPPLPAPHDGDETRRRRAQLLNRILEEGRPDDDLFQHPDFFSLSGCRDLLFHVHEHTFDLPMIGELVRQANLSVIGFEFDHKHEVTAYQQRFPDDPWRRNLRYLQAFEQDHPQTFRGMYTLLLQGS